MCWIGDFNCSQESLTFREALAVLCNLSRTNPDLHKEITGQEESEPTGKEESTFSLDHELLDDTNIPTNVVIDHVVSDEKQVEWGFMVDGNGMVMRDSVAEELEMGDAGNDAEAVCVRGQHVRTKQTLFSGKHMWEDA